MGAIAKYRNIRRQRQRPREIANQLRIKGLADDRYPHSEGNPVGDDVTERASLSTVRHTDGVGRPPGFDLATRTQARNPTMAMIPRYSPVIVQTTRTTGIVGC